MKIKGIYKKMQYMIFSVLTFLALLQTEVVIAQKSAPPDYSNLNYWAASPHKMDTSDKIPAGLNDEETDKRADVFFIHPTSYFGETDTSSWNAWLSDEAVNQETDYKSILFQATAFSGSCRVFAPRYRQANMEVFYKMGTPQAKAAFDLAYNDVKTAFQYYLQNENKGRPIVIASHSQGTLHAIRLLQEFFDGTPLKKQLVCAYIPGYRIKKDALKSIPVSEKPDQTGCFAGWRSYEKGEIPDKILAENGDCVCVNPLTWTTSEEWATSNLHLGIMNGFGTIIPHTVAAGIEPKTKILWVESPKVIIENINKGKDLHIYDYNLFWMNIRENVKLRIDAWMKENRCEK
jgi:hypothetical protein